jgi:hypothetical protein
MSSCQEHLMLVQVIKLYEVLAEREAASDSRPSENKFRVDSNPTIGTVSFQ